MILQTTHFKDLIIISSKKNSDNRGFFREVYRKKNLEDLLSYSVNFCQDNQVKSSYLVLRGLHYQREPYSQSKLVYVSKGKILDIAVDMRRNSKTYGKYFSIILSEEENNALFIPKGFAHGYLTLSKKVFVNYKVDNYYMKDYESGILYNDKHLNIDWGIDEKDLILSEKDKSFDTYKW